MKKIIILFTLFLSFGGYSQTISNPNNTYKKRVLESAEIDIISSYYSQNGDNAAVTGGIGTEKLTDVATDIVISIPLNDDDVFTINATVSAYSSASSSNLDPFDLSGASRNGDDDDDDKSSASNITGSPWVASTGASKSDVWVNGNFGYSHSSNNRNTIVGANINFASEFDYISFGFGGNFTKLFNEKNTEINLRANIYLDTWKPVYPTELDSYLEANQNLNRGFFSTIDILDENGNIIDKNGTNVWSPYNTTLVNNTKRNTYSLSIGFSQILSKRAQISLFLDVVQQQGWLANPMQRVYFGDRVNYYVGNASNIKNYTSSINTDVFQLADDIERLPDSRLKTPIGARFNYYINEFVVLRTYYRYYYDDWGITSQTAEIELPVKISDKFTLYPSYRYYTQTAADYFAPYEQNVSTSEFYTSDYDLSKFNSSQIGFGVSYTDIFTERKIWKFGLKSVDFKYSNYRRNTGLTAGIVSLGFKFIMD
ncbi:hypothetical protein Lupro_10920 [Lutibacter profundi]|uniref:DUF3570 domain-containing protein n=1 Tax=Lutibacter profundi TaxID=1622118 RepID=A0A0X8G815_9FLAO|nr:DUF3570 domain-containing protein [Lutibacter profundi]AMC11749.1 hypothetical protein Lupro_10920 [Lutibacter profundi]